MKIGSGVTAIVFDEPSIASVDLRGGGTGTREVALLDPGATVERIDAITPLRAAPPLALKPPLKSWPVLPNRDAVMR